jgi:hypothetical protein
MPHRDLPEEEDVHSSRRTSMPVPGTVALTVAAGLLIATPFGTASRDDSADRCRSAAVRAVVAKAHCCFTNTRYVGTCDVEPAADETCASILDYLNNPQSQGKAYCGSTTIRGGWRSAACEPKTSGY